MTTRDGRDMRQAESRVRYESQPLAPRYSPAAGASVTELLRQLSTETVSLVRQELELAKAEMREKMDVYQQSMVSIGIGAALLLAALLTALWALNSGLTALLAQGMDLDVAVWLSPLLLTVALAAIGWTMVSRAKARMQGEGLVPRRTTSSLREDSRWAKGKAQELKEEIRHG